MGLNQRKIGVVLSYMQMVAGSVITLLYTPVMLRLLGQSEYGIYNLASSVISYLGLFNFGFGSAYMRYYMKYKSAGDEDGVKRTNGMFLIVFLCIMALAAAAGSVLVANTHLMFDAKLTPYELQKTKVVMGIMVFHIAVVFPANIFSSYVMANENYIYHRAIQLAKTLVNPFVILPVLLMGYKSIGMVVATTAISIATESAFVIYAVVKLKMRFSFKNINFGEMKDMGRFSFFVFLNMMADTVNTNVDKVLLGMYRGTKAVAVYGLASTLQMYFKSFSGAIYSVFVPHIHRLVNKGGQDTELTKLFTKVGRIQFFVLAMITLGFAFFGRQFMIIWGGKQYEEAYFVTLILFISAIIPQIQSMGEEIQRAKNLHHYRSVVYGGIVLINVLMSIPLCRKYGILGCTIGTAFASVAGSGVALNIIYKKKIKINVIYFWKEIAKMLPGLVLPALTGAVILYLAPLENIFVFLGCGVVFVFVYLLSMWLFALNGYEKGLATGVLKKMFKRK